MLITPNVLSPSTVALGPRGLAPGVEAVRVLEESLRAHAGEWDCSLFLPSRNRAHPWSNLFSSWSLRLPFLQAPRDALADDQGQVEGTPSDQHTHRLQTWGSGTPVPRP